MKNERENNQTVPAVTAETQVKDVVPSGMLEDIRTLQAIHNRMEEYKQKKDSQVGTWDTFSESAVKAMNHLSDAMSEMSSLAGSELDFAILNR